MPSAPEASHPGLAAAERLRRVRDALEAGEVPDAADAGWLAQGLERYLTNAAAGVKLEDALGVAVPPGGSPWWFERRRAERDAAIRAPAADSQSTARYGQRQASPTRGPDRADERHRGFERVGFPEPGRGRRDLAG